MWYYVWMFQSPFEVSDVLRGGRSQFGHLLEFQSPFEVSDVLREYIAAHAKKDAFQSPFEVSDVLSGVSSHSRPIPVVSIPFRGF